MYKRQLQDTCTDRIVRTRPVEQVHLNLALPGLARQDPLNHSLVVLNNLLGGGMSSRLFQRIREVRGLAYSVYSYPYSYQHCGVMSIYAGLNGENLQETLEVTLDELDQDVYKRQLKKGSVPPSAANARLAEAGPAGLLLEKGKKTASTPLFTVIFHQVWPQYRYGVRVGAGKTQADASQLFPHIQATEQIRIFMPKAVGKPGRKREVPLGQSLSIGPLAGGYQLVLIHGKPPDCWDKSWP